MYVSPSPGHPPSEFLPSCGYPLLKLRVSSLLFTRSFSPCEFIYLVFHRPFHPLSFNFCRIFLFASHLPFLHRDFCTFLLLNTLTIDFSTFITSALYISSCSSYFFEDTCNCLPAAISSNFLYLRPFLSFLLLALFSAYKLVSFSRSTSINPICFLLLNFLRFLLRVYQVSISHFVQPHFAVCPLTFFFSFFYFSFNKACVYS